MLLRLLPSRLGVRLLPGVGLAVRVRLELRLGLRLWMLFRSDVDGDALLEICVDLLLCTEIECSLLSLPLLGDLPSFLMLLCLDERRDDRRDECIDSKLFCRLPLLILLLLLLPDLLDL